MYLMMCTRSDIVLAMDKMSRFMLNLDKFHWKAVKWIFSYLMSTKDYCLLFDDLLYNVKSLLCYVDDDY